MNFSLVHLKEVVCTCISIGLSCMWPEIVLVVANAKRSENYLMEN